MTMVSIEQIKGKILALTREHLIKEPEDGSGYKHSFFAGKSDQLFRGLGLSWWLTERALHILQDLASMAGEHDPRLLSESEKIEDAIEDVFKEEFDDSRLFDKWALHKADSLFDLIVPSPDDFATEMWRRIHAALLNAIVPWLVVIPLQRIRSESAPVGFDGLSLLAAHDDRWWAEVAAKYSDARLWNPHTGMRRDDSRDSRFFGDTPPPTWLLAEVSGRRDDARGKAYRAAHTFIALVFSDLRATPGLLSKTMARPAGGATQFPADPARARCGQSTVFGGALLPPLGLDLNLSASSLGALASWYTKLADAPAERQKRARTASHFVHYAIMADGLERFVHFFVALDALFGVRGDVEHTITAGISHAFDHDPAWRLRARKLLRLRNEVLHGGSSAIVDWEELGKYKRHFRSDPLRDVGEAAMTGLIRFFDLPETHARQRPRSRAATFRRFLKAKHNER